MKQLFVGRLRLGAGKNFLDLRIVPQRCFEACDKKSCITLCDRPKC